MIDSSVHLRGATDPVETNRIKRQRQRTDWLLFSPFRLKKHNIPAPTGPDADGYLDCVIIARILPLLPTNQVT